MPTMVSWGRLPLLQFKLIFGGKCFGPVWHVQCCNAVFPYTTVLAKGWVNRRLSSPAAGVLEGNLNSSHVGVRHILSITVWTNHMYVSGRKRAGRWECVIGCWLSLTTNAPREFIFKTTNDPNHVDQILQLDWVTHLVFSVWTTHETEIQMIHNFFFFFFLVFNVTEFPPQIVVYVFTRMRTLRHNFRDQFSCTIFEPNALSITGMKMKMKII